MDYAKDTMCFNPGFDRVFQFRFCAWTSTSFHGSGGGFLGTSFPQARRQSFDELGAPLWLGYLFMGGDFQEASLFSEKVLG